MNDEEIDTIIALRHTALEKLKSLKKDNEVFKLYKKLVDAPKGDWKALEVAWLHIYAAGNIIIANEEHGNSPKRKSKKNTKPT